MIQQVKDPQKTDVDDGLEVAPRSKVTIHSVMLVIVLSLVVTFLMVIGVNYLYEANNLKGQSAKYFCPSASSTQVGVCVKS